MNQKTVSFPAVPKPTHAELTSIEASFEKRHPRPSPDDAVASEEWQKHKEKIVSQAISSMEWDHWRKLFLVNESMLHAIEGAHKHLAANSPAGDAVKRDIEELLVQWGKL